MKQRCFSLGQLVVYRGTAQRLWGLGQRVIPNLYSRLGCSPGGAEKENLWRREVKKRNNSILASCSPRHTRFPEDTQQMSCIYTINTVFFKEIHLNHIIFLQPLSLKQLKNRAGCGLWSPPSCVKNTHKRLRASNALYQYLFSSVKPLD